jgi:lipoate-protein ligase B
MLTWKCSKGWNRHDPKERPDVGMNLKPWLCVEVPLMDYQKALELQRALVAAKAASVLSRDVLLLLEHPPVFTLGRRGNRKHVLVAEAFLGSRGIQVCHVERGGDVTYHGPGQLVAYPIVDLRAGRWKVLAFVEALEEVMIRTVSDWGITAERNSMNRGVWVGNNKLGSVGIAIRRGISYHGLALNVNTSMEPFSWINPCGLEGVGVISMKQALGREIPMEGVRRAAGLHIQEVFGVEFERMRLEAIYGLLGNQDSQLSRSAKEK